jgi:hypothetical protein
MPGNRHIIGRMSLFTNGHSADRQTIGTKKKPHATLLGGRGAGVVAHIVPGAPQSGQTPLAPTKPTFGTQ